MGEAQQTHFPDPDGPMTAWTLVQRAQGRHGDSTTRKLCLDYLAARYWKPVFALIRRSGHSEQDALDLTQGYFATFLEKNFLDQVSPARGRLRHFICKSATNFLLNWKDAQGTAKRRPKGGLVRLDLESEAGGPGPLPVPADGDTPEEAYMREWARSVMAEALAEMERACQEEGQDGYWEVFRRHVSEAARFDNPSYEGTAASLGWDVEKVRRTLHRARQKFSTVARKLLRDSVADDDDVASELSDLRRYFPESAT